MPDREFKILLAFSRLNPPENVCAQAYPLLAQCNWQRLLELAFYHGTAPLFYENARKLPGPQQAMPEQILERLKSIYYANLSRTLKFWEEFCRIEDKLKTAGIALIPLKGIALGNILYRNPGLRPLFADIDVLVRQEDAAGAGEILKAMGYALSPYRPGHVHSFRNRQFIVEVHWQLLPPRLNCIDTEALWKRAAEYEVAGRKTLSLSWEDLLLTLPLQVRHEWPNLKLFRLCDLNEILCQHHSSLDESYLSTAGRNYQLRNTLCLSLYLCANLVQNNLAAGLAKRLLPHYTQRKLLFSLWESERGFLLENGLKAKGGFRNKLLVKLSLCDSLSHCARACLYKI